MFKKAKTESQLDDAIERALLDLSTYPPNSDEFGTVLDRVNKLHKMKEAEMQASRVKPDTLLLAATNLLGIAIIVRHENVNVITSKALGFVKKSF